jgi:ribosomal-protein-alanine N-acetyltransferase
MKPPERVETEHPVLRKPHTNDALAIFEGWAQDHEVTRYLTWHLHQRVEQTQEFSGSCLFAWEREIRFPYAITLGETDEVIGMIDPRIEGARWASQGVLEKVGMQREGTLRKYIVHPNISDIPRDSYIYATTK